MNRTKENKANFATDAAKKTICYQIVPDQPITCGKQGHIRPACLKAAANNTNGRQEEDDQHLADKLASMRIDNPMDTQQGAAQAVHSLYSTASNKPTPAMLL